jgi:hypothetical protein
VVGRSPTSKPLRSVPWYPDPVPEGQFPSCSKPRVFRICADGCAWLPLRDGELCARSTRRRVTSRNQGMPKGRRRHLGGHSLWVLLQLLSHRRVTIALAAKRSTSACLPSPTRGS